MPHRTFRDRAIASTFGVIAVVLASVALAASPWLLGFAVVLGAAAVLAALRGYPIDRVW